jgi:CHAT domain-containing protein
MSVGALRREAEGESVASRFTICRAPSASTWLHWRRTRVTLAEKPALVLVEPDVSAHLRLPVARTLENDVRGPLGPLPHARSEARAALRYLGPGCLRLQGAEATESFVKRADLRKYRVLHLAAHALVDDSRPERSAVLLAPGSGEDGFLTIPEVAGLDLGGSVVVLSGCRSASGALVEGEGVLSLARAFLAAGANAVVGSLWPLRDDEAAALFEDFYRHLGAGGSVQDSLTDSRRERIRAGAPTAAWAGVVVFGEGILVPFPGGVR